MLMLMGGRAASIGTRSSRTSASDASEVAPMKDHTRERVSQHATGRGSRGEQEGGADGMLITKQTLTQSYEQRNWATSICRRSQYV